MKGKVLRAEKWKTKELQQNPLDMRAPVYSSNYFAEVWIILDGGQLYVKHDSGKFLSDVDGGLNAHQYRYDGK